MRQFINQIQWEISHNNSQKAGASKIHFFAKDTPDLNFKERADQWQQLKENKPEEIRRSAIADKGLRWIAEDSQKHIVQSSNGTK